MDSRDLRSHFRAFAGAERYSKFLSCMNLTSRVKGRLLYWQEQLWDAFISSSGFQSIDFVDLVEIFGICETHDCPLQVPAERKPLPEIRHTPEYATARETIFPCADSNWICLDCRAAAQRWIDENAELCSLLRCQTTYIGFYERRGLTDPGNKFPESVMLRIMEREREIAAGMRPGDELWEWDSGGSNFGKGGLAVVRDGRIIRKWSEFK